MDLEKQVCSLELSKKLKKLGFDQNSLFYWKWDLNDELASYKVPFLARSLSCIEDVKIICSAYTMEELNEIFPKNCDVNRNIVETGIRENDTKIDAMAKMLIYLKENNLI